MLNKEEYDLDMILTKIFLDDEKPVKLHQYKREYICNGNTVPHDSAEAHIPLE